MNSTANYSLNQWDASDRIMREDFNADNAKIDAALKSLQPTFVPYVPLRTITTSASTQQIDITLSDIDWSVYRHLLLHVNLATDSDYSIGIRLNGLSGTYDYVCTNSSGSGEFASMWGAFSGNHTNQYRTTLLITGGITAPQCTMQSFGSRGNTTYTCGNAAANPITTLNLLMINGQILAGGTITIYGVRI